jgi:methionyl aminopeptidase
MSGALAVGRGVAFFARRGTMRAAGRAQVLVSCATPPPKAPAAQQPSNHHQRRALVIANGKKKGFAEMLGDLTAPKDVGDFQGRPRLVKGKVTAKQHVPPHIKKPPYADSGILPDMSEAIQVHDAEQIEKMRRAGRLAAEVLDFAESIAKPGVTTDFIDQKVHAMIIENGAYPSPLNYGGFPKSVCTSLNECICHGIPDDTILMDGDIINIDVTVYLDGHHGDTSRTVFVGNVSDEVRALVRATDESLKAAIDVCKPGTPVRKIGATIHQIAEERGYGVVEKFVGHGVGREFHSGPTVRHHRNNDSGCLVLGQTFTIEPMLTIGKTKDETWRDGWTAVTADGKWTAQCEHTLLVVEDGVEILTASPKGLWGPLKALNREEKKV